VNLGKFNDIFERKCVLYIQKASLHVGWIVSMRIKEIVVDTLWMRPCTNITKELPQLHCGNLKIEFIPKHCVGSGTPLQ